MAFRRSLHKQDLTDSNIGVIIIASLQLPEKELAEQLKRAAACTQKATNVWVGYCGPAATASLAAMDEVEKALGNLSLFSGVTGRLTMIKTSHKRLPSHSRAVR
jgi:hypothetical protein